MLHIQLFGTTTATNDACATTVTNFGGAKPRQILEILALADGVPVAKDRLADLQGRKDQDSATTKRFAAGPAPVRSSAEPTRFIPT